MGYYFIGIGGSGAKVMESLTHLAAAGILPNVPRQERLYVMSVDPDVGNGNLKRSSAALNNLSVFQELGFGADTSLFKTEVMLAHPFPWSPTEHDKKLDDILTYQSLSGTPIGNLYETLYTRAERNTFLNEGFRGRPSIGAAVLARKAALFETQGWEDHAEAPWDKFARLVKQDAKNGQVAHIFLAGSVFGGTGAAGMPTIAKLLRREFASYGESGTVAIGGALILPFFGFTPQQENGDGQIYASSENFLTNTKAALKYYAAKYRQDKVFDAMYFIGDSVLSSVQRFSVGAASQMNDAHIVDFYGAMAAVHFFSSSVDHMLECSYIAHENADSFEWTDFPDILGADGKEIRFKERFAQFVRFVFGYAHFVKPVLARLASGEEKTYKYPWYVDYLDGVDVDTPEVKNFDEYVESFVRWLAQLESGSNNRKVDFVRTDAFRADPAEVDPVRFPQCICGSQSELSMHELWTRLAEHAATDQEAGAQGFGRFLRALYDCCKE